MVRSACLPDETTLKGLLGRMDAPALRLRRPPRSALPPPPSWPPAASVVAPSMDRARGTNLFELTNELESDLSTEERFSVFVRWLREQTSARSVFVVDADGLSMTREATDDGHRAVAGNLGASMTSVVSLVPNVVQSSTRLRLISGEFLELIWCETSLGRFGVGVASLIPLAPEWLTVIPDALRGVADARQADAR